MSHAETWAKTPKDHFVAGGPPADKNIIGGGVNAVLSDWPYFSSLFHVCPQSEAMSPGAAITINVNQVLHCNFGHLTLWSHAVQIDYSVKLFADLGDTNSTYNSHRAYSFSDKIFTAGFSSVMLKVRALHSIDSTWLLFPRVSLNCTGCRQWRRRLLRYQRLRHHRVSWPSGCDSAQGVHSHQSVRTCCSKQRSS